MCHRLFERCERLRGIPHRVIERDESAPALTSAGTSSSEAAKTTQGTLKISAHQATRSRIVSNGMRLPATCSPNIT
jgi:hypothetical protein